MHAKLAVATRALKTHERPEGNRRPRRVFRWAVEANLHHGKGTIIRVSARECVRECALGVQRVSRCEAWQRQAGEAEGSQQA